MRAHRAQEWNIIQLACQWLLIPELSDPVISYGACRFKHQMSQKWHVCVKQGHSLCDNQSPHDSSTKLYAVSVMGTGWPGRAPDAALLWMPPQKNPIQENPAARHTWFLTSAPFLAQILPLHHLKHITENWRFFSPEVFLIKNAFEKCPLLRAFGLQLCTRTTLALGIPATVLWLSPTTRSWFLREQ